MFEIIEVGPRDGLQNEPTLLATDDKLHLINQLIAAGGRRIEVASFVHPKRVPQMADAEAVVAGLPLRPDVTYVGLVLNKRGALRALDTRTATGGIDELGAVAVATDSFGTRNQGQTREQAVAAAGDILRLAKDAGVPAQVTVSVAFGCPFEGAVDPDSVCAIVDQLAAFEPKEIALADTIGVAVPAQVTSLFQRVIKQHPTLPFRAHFHDTRGMGMANVWAAYQAGVRRFDASVGGLGGCPFAPGATGNIATEDLVYLFEKSSQTTGLNLDALIETAKSINTALGRQDLSALARSGGFPS